MDINDLKQKPLWQMTGEEFLYLQQDADKSQQTVVHPINDGEKKYVYGIVGIANLFMYK